MADISKIKYAIKSALDFRNVVQSYGINFNRNGFAKCPFHDERTASFSVKNGYGHCFGCGWNGDVITFVEQYFQLDYLHALDKLCNDFNLPYRIGEPEKFSDRYKADKLARERKKREQKIKEQHNQLLEKLNKYMIVYVAYDRWKREAPINSSRYAEACRNYDTSKYLYEEAEYELIRFEQRYCIDS